MEQGTLYSENWNTECRVLHIFRHKTWVAYKGRISSIPHKYVNKKRLVPGESTYRTTGRLSLGQASKVLQDLMDEYKKLL